MSYWSCFGYIIKTFYKTTGTLLYVTFLFLTFRTLWILQQHYYVFLEMLCPVCLEFTSLLHFLINESEILREDFV